MWIGSTGLPRSVNFRGLFFATRVTNCISARSSLVRGAGVGNRDNFGSVGFFRIFRGLAAFAGTNAGSGTGIGRTWGGASLFLKARIVVFAGRVCTGVLGVANQNRHTMTAAAAAATAITESFIERVRLALSVTRASVRRSSPSVSGASQ